MTRTAPGVRALVLAAAVLAPALGAGCLGIGASDDAPRPAPAFTLTTIEGENVTLADYRGSVLVLDMMATWCGPCKEAMPAFREYLAAHADDPVAVLSVDVDQSETQGGRDPLPAFMADYNATWPAAYDTDDLYSKYRLHGIPTLIVVDAQGNLVEKSQLSRVTVESLEKLLAPYVEEARAS